MFRPGRILQFGGNSNGAIVIDINGAHAGRHADAVDVVAAPAGQRDDPADGKVLATGGSQVDNELTGVNNIAEIWNPATGTWTQGTMARRRACTTRPRCCCPTRRVLVARRRRARATARTT